MTTTTRPDDLNPRQWEAVTHAQGNLLIVAGPGTGKTHTLTHRMLHILTHLPRGKKLLAITFTKKAAEEMRRRLSKHGAATDESVTVGTFHQCCLEILRAFAGKTALPKDFRVAAEDEIETLSKRLWPQASGRERRMALAGISRWKSAALDEPAPPEVRLYDAALRSQGMLDFDDLLLETLNLLRNNREVSAELQDRYAHIFVDEYQDINAVQHALLKFLVHADNAITAIGDPNQAIYGFRGADVRFFHSFITDFPAAVTLSLTDNYRSAQNILSASGQVMANADHARVPALTARIYRQGRLRIHAAATDKAEAEYVTHQIEKMVGGTSLFSYDSARVGSAEDGHRSFGDIAVFYRLNSQCLALRKALDRSGIPYQVSGGEACGDPEEMIDQLCMAAPVEPQVSAEKVSLMTLHAGKGLEFPAVFIVGCEQNILPLAMGGLVSDMEEERRLFYVGMTRAKEELFLVRAGRRFLYGEKQCNPPSAFLADIEEALKEYERPEGPQRPNKGDAQLTLFS